MGGVLVLGAVALGVFFIALDHGGYSIEQRDTMGIVVWWLLGLGTAAGILRVRLGRSAWATCAGLIALAAVELASVLWSHDAQSAVAESERVLVYLGVFLLAIALASTWGTAVLVDGLAVGLSAVAAIALISRCVPELGLGRESAVFSLVSANRLSYPLDYWNGLAALVALAVPLLVRRAAEPGRLAVRAAAIAPLPTVAGVLYLTSSRGGIVVAAVATVVLFVLTPRPWRTLGALAAGGIPASVGVAVLARSPQLANGPLAGGPAHWQGHRAAAIFVGLTAAAVVIQVVLGVLEPRLPQQGRRSGRALQAVAVAVIAIGIVASHPIRTLDHFKAPPTHVQTGDGFATGHLLSLNGSGRWQQWSAAVDEWHAHPVVGGGAGSYYRWWLQHGSLTLQVRNAHSLYLETLAELGLIGLAALLLALLAPVAGAIFRVGRGPLPVRTETAALLGAAVGFLVGAGIDWLWQLSAIGAVALALLGLLTVSGVSRALASRREGGGWSGIGWTAIALAAAVPLSAALLAELYLGQSRAAASIPNVAAARAAARNAEALEPWSADPRLQLALLDEQSGRLVRARHEIDAALTKNRNDWSLWLVRSRIELRLGDVSAARRSLGRAAALNPESSLFPGVTHSTP